MSEVFGWKLHRSDQYGSAFVTFAKSEWSGTGVLRLVRDEVVAEAESWCTEHIRSDHWRSATVDTVTAILVVDPASAFEFRMRWC